MQQGAVEPLFFSSRIAVAWDGSSPPLPLLLVLVLLLLLLLLVLLVLLRTVLYLEPRSGWIFQGECSKLSRSAA